MIPKTLLKKTIFALNDLAKILYGVDIHTPTEQQLATNKKTIEAILPPSDRKRYVTQPFAMRVSIAYQYAKTHYLNPGTSLLSDIEQGVRIKAKDIPKMRKL